MKSGKLHRLSYVFLCLFFWQTQAQTTAPEIPTENLPIENPQTEDALIHSGDLVDVDVLGSLEYDWRGTTNPEGFLSGISYIENQIYALCRTEEAVAADVAKAYSKILRQPKVVVKILDRSSRPFSVLYGAVKTPQRFQLKRPVLLNELIISAGGITDKASGEIQIFRPQNLNCQIKNTEIKIAETSVKEKRERHAADVQNGGSQYINIKISDLLTGKKESNPRILSGDIITILESESIYVIGGVSNPRQISARSKITLSRAVASAGGLSKDAVAENVTIFRRDGSVSKTIEADLNKIKNNQAEDVLLQAFDVVEIAQKGRAKRKFPPVIKVSETGAKNTAGLPLRIIE